MSLENKIDRIQDDVTEIKTHLAAYNEQLKEHIRRTEALEHRVEVLDKYLNRALGAIALLSFIALVIEALGRLR